MISLRKCVECGEEFELKPNKPGLATYCPAHSPASRLLPTEARKVHQEQRSQSIETIFRDTIQEHIQARSAGQSARADDLEKQIRMWDKKRRTPFIK